MDMPNSPSGLPRISEPAPEFSANSSQGPIKLSQYRGKWVMLFSHPADFTPVCTTEIAEFARRNDEFVKRNVQLLGLSVDSVPAHIAWTRDVAKIAGKPVPFPIIADLDMKVSNLYGMLHPGESATATVRSVFFIDDKGVIRALIYYPLSTGRNVDELLRVFDSLQTTSLHGVSTPVDWKPGEPVVIPAPATAESVLDEAQAAAQGLTFRTWYLRLKQVDSAK